MCCRRLSDVIFVDRFRRCLNEGLASCGVKDCDEESVVHSHYRSWSSHILREHSMQDCRHSSARSNLCCRCRRQVRLATVLTA